MNEIDNEECLANLRYTIKNVIRNNEQLIKFIHIFKDRQDNQGRTTLHIFAEIGYQKAVNMLIAAGANVNIQDEDGNTALHIAVAKGHTEIVDLLVEAGAKINIYNNSGKIPFDLANNKNCTEIINLLFHGLLMTLDQMIGKKIDWDIPDVYKLTPLHLAAYGHDAAMVRELIQSGADVDAKDAYGNTPLHLALLNEHFDYSDSDDSDSEDSDSEDSDNEDSDNEGSDNEDSDSDDSDNEGSDNEGSDNTKNIFQQLVPAREKINAQNKNGYTILHLAAKNGNIKLFKELIAAGADVNVQDDYGQTVLHLINYNDIKLFKELIAAGTDVNAQDNYGQTVLHIISMDNTLNNQDLNKKLVQLLINQRANLNVTDKNGQTGLHKAALSGQIKLVNTLTVRGANIHAKDNNGNTALHLAAKSCFKNIILKLLEKGADVNARNKKGENLLHIINTDAGTEAFQEVIDRGADIHAKDNNGNTPLHLAAARGQMQLVKKLIEKGADVNAKNNDGDDTIAFVIWHNLKHNSKSAVISFEHILKDLNDNKNIDQIDDVLYKLLKYFHTFQNNGDDFGKLIITKLENSIKKVIKGFANKLAANKQNKDFELKKHLDTRSNIKDFEKTLCLIKEALNREDIPINDNITYLKQIIVSNYQTVCSVYEKSNLSITQITKCIKSSEKNTELPEHVENKVTAFLSNKDIAKLLKTKLNSKKAEPVESTKSILEPIAKRHKTDLISRMPEIKVDTPTREGLRIEDDSSEVNVTGDTDPYKGDGGVEECKMNS